MEYLIERSLVAEGQQGVVGGGEMFRRGYCPRGSDGSSSVAVGRDEELSRSGEAETRSGKMGNCKGRARWS